jgi:hypothetical protein
MIVRTGPVTQGAGEIEMPFTSKERDRFDLMFYQWSHARTLEELASGFDAVIRARVFTYSHVETMSRTTPSEREPTAIARLKKWQLRGAELNGEPLSQREKTLLERFERLRLDVLAETPIGGPRRDAAQIRRRLVKSLKLQLPDVLGEIAGDETARRARDWTHLREVQGHIVKTRCDATGPERTDDFTYCHWIRERGEPLASAFGTSWLTWLGIYATQWRLNDEEEIPFVIEAVKNASRQFFEALPAMLPVAR